jgi:putative addiction module killer protein
MNEIRRTDSFEKWLKNLKDRIGKALILRRIDRLTKGNSGDVRPIGEGCSEMRIDYGPGYRVYYKNTGKEIIVLLCGGDKSTQIQDIKGAKELAKEI